MPRIRTRRECARRAADEEDDVPILELVNRGDYLDASWRAPGRGKIYEIHKIVDWKVKKGAILFLVWWKDYALRESSWEPAASIHPIKQLLFFKSIGVFD